MRPRFAAALEHLLGPWAGVLVPNYVVMLAAGCLLAAVVVVDEARRQGYARRDTLTVLMAAYAGGLLGAAAVPFAQGLAALAATGAFVPPTGLAAYGGLIGGVAAGALALRRLGRPVAPFLDAAAPAIGLGYFVARLGCLLAGCDYGRPTTLPGALRFPPGSHAWLDHVRRGWIAPDAPASLPVHPTQLYASFLGLALFLALRRLPARGDGRRFGALVLAYAVGRSLIELLRGDASRGHVGPLSTSQVLAALTVVLLLAVGGVARRRALLASYSDRRQDLGGP